MNLNVTVAEGMLYIVSLVLYGCISCRMFLHAASLFAAGCSMTTFTKGPSGFIGTVLVPLCSWHSEFQSVEEGMNATLVVHNDSTGLGGIYTRFSVVEVQKVLNKRLREK